MQWQSERVLTKDPHQKNPENYQFFAEYDEEEPTKLLAGLYFDNQTWDDMDRPEQVTVRIQPGDTLNPKNVAQAIFGKDDA